MGAGEENGGWPTSSFKIGKAGKVKAGIAKIKAKQHAGGGKKNHYLAGKNACFRLQFPMSK